VTKKSRRKHEDPPRKGEHSQKKEIKTPTSNSKQERRQVNVKMSTSMQVGRGSRAARFDWSITEKRSKKQKRGRLTSIGAHFCKKGQLPVTETASCCMLLCHGTRSGGAEKRAGAGKKFSLLGYRKVGPHQLTNPDDVLRVTSGKDVK